MNLTPGYGETPLPNDELAALLPAARDLLEPSLTKAAVYDLEQEIQDDITETMVSAVLEGNIQLEELVTDFFLRELHFLLYGQVWDWAGKFRRRELNIGVAPEQIAMELRGSLDTIRYRWEHTGDWTAQQFGIVTHAEEVRIHPFVDGNGRSTRLHADLIFLATQETEKPKLYDWQLDKRHYIDLLRAYDQHRDPKALAAFIETVSVEQ